MFADRKGNASLNGAFKFHEQAGDPASRLCPDTLWPAPSINHAARNTVPTGADASQNRTVRIAHTPVVELGNGYGGPRHIRGAARSRG